MPVQYMHLDIFQNSQRDRLPVENMVQRMCMPRKYKYVIVTFLSGIPKQYELAWVNCLSREELPIRVGVGRFLTVFSYKN